MAHFVSQMRQDNALWPEGLNRFNCTVYIEVKRMFCPAQAVNQYRIYPLEQRIGALGILLQSVR